MKRNYEPGDVEIIKISLAKWTKGHPAKLIDIRAQVVDINIYEDIMEPSMMLEMTLIDGINLVQDYPITGEEIIAISFVTPGREMPFVKVFNVFNVSGGSNSPGAKSSIYTIKAVTPLHYFSTGFTVRKSYNTTVDEIVSDIIRDIAKDNILATPSLNIEKTRGLINLTAPKASPFATIDMLRQKAVSAEFPSGGIFMFFENQYGLHFKSVELLLTEGKADIASRVFTSGPSTSADKARSAYAFRNIINYTRLGNFDAISKAGGGTITNTVRSFDVLTKDTETTTFNISEKMGNFVTADKKNAMSASTTYIEQFKGKGNLMFVPKDSSKGNDYIDYTMGTKAAYLNLLNESAVRIYVYGDNTLTAGDVLELNFPDTSGTTERKYNDRMLSGNYLVTKLRHIVTMEEGAKPKHHISMDCSKIGYK